MVWVILSLLAAIFVGLIGHVYMLPEKLVGTDAETDIPRYDGTFIYAIYGWPYLVCCACSYHEYCIRSTISNSLCYC